MNLLKKVITVAIAGAIGIASCTKDNAEDMYPAAPDCDLSNVTYSLTIKPMLADKCLSCHTGTVLTGYDFTKYETLKSVADNGKLMDAINHTGSAEPMPQGLPKLDDCSIKKFEKWVADDAPDN